MRYFKLFEDWTISARWHLGEIVFPDGTEPWLADGIPLAQPGSLSTEVHHEGPPLEYCITSFNVPVVSSHLAEAIRSISGSDIQYLPLTVSGHGERVILNVVRVVRCLDESRSKFIKWTAQDHRADLAGEYRSVPQLVIDPSAVPDDAHFFRVQAWEVALIVSDVAKGVMERAGCRGATFTEVSPTG